MLGKPAKAPPRRTSLSWALYPPSFSFLFNLSGFAEACQQTSQAASGHVTRCAPPPLSLSDTGTVALIRYAGIDPSFAIQRHRRATAPNDGVVAFRKPCSAERPALGCSRMRPGAFLNPETFVNVIRGQDEVRINRINVEPDVSCARKNWIHGHQCLEGSMCETPAI
jgi:hypothetical protein